MRSNKPESTEVDPIEPNPTESDPTESDPTESDHGEIHPTEIDPLDVVVERDDPADADQSETAAPDDDDKTDDEVYEVEAILKHTKKKGQMHYLVKWKGYDGKNDNSWEPLEMLLDGALSSIEEYEERKKIPEADKVKALLAPKPSKTTRKTSAKEESSSSSDEEEEAPNRNDSDVHVVSSDHEFENDQTSASSEDESDEQYDSDVIVTRSSQKSVIDERPTRLSARLSTARDTEDGSSDSDEDHKHGHSKRSKQVHWESTDRIIKVGNQIKSVTVIIDDAYPVSPRAWTHDIKKVIAAIKDKDEFAIIVEWNNGDYSLHDVDLIREKCPEKLLDFYQKHLIFSSV